MNRVGLFFGSFDPPHIGHANVVMGVVNSKLVDKVLVIPAYQNVWKSNSSEFSYRLAMCKMTFSPLAPEVYVNAVEKSMYVPSYSKGIPTYDVLMELKSQMYLKTITLALSITNFMMIIIQNIWTHLIL